MKSFYMAMATKMGWNRFTFHWSLAHVILCVSRGIYITTVSWWLTLNSMARFVLISLRFVPKCPGNRVVKHFPKAKLTKNYDAIWRHYAGFSELTGIHILPLHVVQFADIWFTEHLFLSSDMYISTTGLTLCLRPANERRRYKVTPSLIGWAQA